MEEKLPWEFFFPVRPTFKELTGKHGEKNSSGRLFHIFPLIFQIAEEVRKVTKRATKILKAHT